MSNSAIMPYAPVVLKLLQNPLFSDETASWNLLLSYLTPVQEYFARIGLEVSVHEEDGYAYLHQDHRGSGARTARTFLARANR